jgi:hypothetical protein
VQRSLPSGLFRVVFRMQRMTPRADPPDASSLASDALRLRQDDNVVNRTFPFCRPAHILRRGPARHAASHRVDYLKHAASKKIGAVSPAAANSVTE